MCPKVYQEDHVGVLNRPISIDPFDESIAATALIWKVSCGKLFVFFIRSYPHMMIHKTSTLPPPGVWRGKRERVVARKELISVGSPSEFFTVGLINLHVRPVSSLR